MGDSRSIYNAKCAQDKAEYTNMHLKCTSDETRKVKRSGYTNSKQVVGQIKKNKDSTVI